MPVFLRRRVITRLPRKATPILLSNSDGSPGSLGRVTSKQKKFLRKLVLILSDIIDEDSDRTLGVDGGEDDPKLEVVHSPPPIDISPRVDPVNVLESGSRPTALAQESESPLLQPVRTDFTTSQTPESISKHFPLQDNLQGGSGNEPEPEDSVEGDNVQGFRKLKRLIEDFLQVSSQIRSNMNALGGGGRIAQALTLFQILIGRLREEHNNYVCTAPDYDPIPMNPIKNDTLDVPDVLSTLKVLPDAIAELSAAVKELRIYNASFFDKLERLDETIKKASPLFELEYGRVQEVHQHDSYIRDVMLWRPLSEAFGDFFREISNIADKEIPAIRQSQEFTTQRYINLTTVATFLSSVTVTALQITVDGSTGSPAVLIDVMNTFWFCSLVFSMASAIYSLLIMTWIKAPVRPPNLSLARVPWLLSWLGNGSMFSLAGASVSFMIGLCILAYSIAPTQGIAPSVAVTVLVGLHGVVLFALTSWFLIEQWSAKYIIWPKIHKKFTSVMKDMIHDFKAAIPDHRLDSIVVDEKKLGIFDINEIKGKGKALAESALNESLYDKILEFSPNGRFLASCISTGITVYDTTQMHIYRRYKFPIVSSDVIVVRQISWSNSGSQLLIRTDRRVQVWDVEAHSIVGLLKRHTQKVHWASKELADRWKWEEAKTASDSIRDSDDDEWFEDEPVEAPPEKPIAEKPECFLAAERNTIGVYSLECNKLDSFALFTPIEAMVQIRDFAFCGDYILCLCFTKEGMSHSTALLVYDIKGETIVKWNAIQVRYTSMALSATLDIAILSGEKSDIPPRMFRISNTVRGKEKRKEKDDGLSFEFLPFWTDLANLRHLLGGPYKAITFGGWNDKLVIVASTCNVAILYSPNVPSQSLQYTPLHVFSTGTISATLANPFGFACNLAAVPYMFAFSAPEGVIKVWSVQSNPLYLRAPSEILKLQDEFQRGDIEFQGKVVTLAPSAEMLGQDPA